MQKVNLGDYDDNDPATRPDADNPAWRAEDFKNAKPALDVVAEVFGAVAAESLRRGRGRPAKPPGEKKVRLSLRVEGKGWQSRINHLPRAHMRDGM